jgi:UDP-glucuronate 4-epimerase|tara:strand:+ start:1760 stop:2764 length:1005 start_codon:yes stop_codon:yes gene_type:complete
VRVLVTGAAGFIGMHLSERLAREGNEVFGVDNLNSYYDVSLKKSRLSLLERSDNFSFMETDIRDEKALSTAFNVSDPHCVVHLAAQAGVRYSIENPREYVSTNVSGTLNILEECKRKMLSHLVYASSSSVYGASNDLPFSIKSSANRPVSLYAATKKATEMMAYSYSDLFGLRTTGLRLFTVYGPWGRPDMALFTFTRKIISGEPIDVYNYGEHRRDFTYIDDIVDGICKVLSSSPEARTDVQTFDSNRSISRAPFQIYNLGNSQPVKLLELIEILSHALGLEVKTNMLDAQLGDVPDTLADITESVRDFGYSPETDIKEGVESFVKWYRGYYG